jgi:hypothetical protein
MKKIVSEIVFIFLIVLSLRLSAAHNRSGEILYKRIAPFSTVIGGVTVPLFTYSITVIKYFDDGAGIADRCEDSVNFGDGTKGAAQRINGAGGCGCPNCGVLIQNDPTYKIKLSIFSIIHTYAGAGSYVVSSADPNRSGGVHNIPNSDQVPFVIQSLIIINSAGINSSPVLTNPPIYLANRQTCFYFNPCAFDADGDSLSYEIVPCLAPGYFDPESGNNGTFTINPVSGMLSWCFPQFSGIYNLAIRVKEWRKTDCGGPYQLNGYVTRDMQVIVVLSPTVAFSSGSSFADGCVVAGSTYSRSFAANISPSTSYSVNLYGYAGFTSNLPIATISPTVGSTNLSSTFNWQTNCSHIQREAHAIHLVYKTQRQSFYKQFALKVIPPAPSVYNITGDSTGITVYWNVVTTCTSNVRGYNIYRKIGANSWVHSACETGLPANSGFQLIGTVGPTDNFYTDTSLPFTGNSNPNNYAVVTVMNDCSESFAENIKSISTLIRVNADSFLNNIGVYPNPFTNHIEISLPTNYDGNLGIAIYGIDGQLLSRTSKKQVGAKTILALDDLPKGMYMLEIKTDKGLVSKKIVKE